MGRADDAEVCLSRVGVSRRHARILVRVGGIVTVTDLASTNGTFVNEGRVHSAILRAGDHVGFGSEATLRFAYRSPDALEVSAMIEVSPRELEVSSLVAEGLTNAEIATRLTISVHTVMSHLANIYDRVGTRSRIALVKLVVQGRLHERRRKR